MIITKSILERVSFDPILFLQKKKRSKHCCLYEMEQLREWLFNFIIENQNYSNVLKVTINKKEP
jgi:hypothetical protein